ncbi:hypothetical protein F5Y12DRAFT_271695 [Xylaria sp. FL1777]|nr:hypothetical protein F5Y12DRAFT_271695 [Xylaria sp. FL1777]
MTVSRRQESLLRLEALGHLSDHYSNITSTNTRSSSRSMDLNDESQWKLDININNKTRTPTVIFDKPPSPRHRVNKRMVGEGAMPSTLDEHSSMFNLGKICVFPNTIPLANEPCRTHSDGGQLQAFNTAQLRPAKDLRRTRHPSKPGTGSQSSGSEPSASDSSKAPEALNEQYKVQDHSAVLCPGQPSYTPTAPNGNHTYRRASISLCETPSSYDYAIDDDDTRSNCSNSTYLYARRPTKDLLSRRGAQSAPGARPLPPQAEVRVDGVDFKMVSAPVASTYSSAPAPIPISAPTHAPTPTPTISSTNGSERRVSTSSIYSRSSSPAYGAWESDQPRQKRPSFLERAQARLEHSFHEHLVKAGLRPPHSFNVLKVEKSSGNRPKDEARKSAVLSRSTGVQPTASNTRAKKRQSKETWDISSGSEAELEAEAEMSQVKQRLLRAASPPSVTPAGGTAPTCSVRRGPSLHVNTSFEDSSVPLGIVELQASKNHDCGSVSGYEKPLELPAVPFDRYDDSDTDGLAPTNSSNDSLFLGHGKSSMQSAASSSFFASEYAQRRAASMERDQEAQQPSQAQSSAMHQEDQDKESKVNRAKSAPPLSLEQLQFAALPSPFEDLGQPFPFDNRRDLPSQTKQQDTSRRTLIKRKDIPLRSATK